MLEEALALGAQAQVGGDDLHVARGVCIEEGCIVERGLHHEDEDEPAHELGAKGDKVGAQLRLRLTMHPVVASQPTRGHCSLHGSWTKSLLVALIEKFHPSCASDVASASLATLRSQAVEFWTPSQSVVFARAQEAQAARTNKPRPPGLIPGHDRTSAACQV